MRLPQRRRRAPLRARLLFVLYAARLLLPRLLIVVAITIGGGLVLQLRWPTDIPLVDASYLVYTQLFFEHVSELPKDPVLRVLFFGIPLLGAFVLAEGLFKLGASLFEFENHREAWMRIMASTASDHVVLVGLGHVGFRVLEDLLQRDVDVVIIESTDDGPFVEEARHRGIPLLIGDARRESLLIEAGIVDARSVVACTDNDLVNLEVALDSKKLNPNIRLVVRMFDQGMAQKIGDAFSIPAMFSTSALAAPLFAAAALDETVHGAYRLGDTLMVSLEVRIRGQLTGKTVSALEETFDAPIVGLHRQGAKVGHRFVRTETLNQDDAVVVHCPATELESLLARARDAENA